MKRIALRSQKARTPQALVCHFCQSSATPTRNIRPQFARSYASATPSPRSSQFGQWRPQKDIEPSWNYTRLPSKRFTSNVSDPVTTQNPEEVLRQIAHESTELRSRDAVPSNEAVVEILQRCEGLAEKLVLPEAEKTKTASKQEGEISSILHLEEKNNAKKRSKSQRNNPQPQLAKSLSDISYELLTDEKVFITPEALASYTKIHTLLKRAEHFPEIFRLYANKPVPEEDSSPVKFHKADPKSVNSAIPTNLANMALDIAIEQRNLPLVLAIIDNTFCAPAFHRAKFFKKAAIPIGGLATAPAACYVIASWVGTLQNTMDPSTATGIAFAASLAYVGGVSSVGMLAITTANDQMERVTWLPGVPLRHRWLREEERAALDRVSMAWGFKDVYMRGEEEGEEWESLREFIGMRGMVLDKTELLPGME
ncbi:hypothetical protein FE257_007008 [Aspergillus nanangensis]|uniref:Uncharacterized protein n=1 Tax=Aspergillus nanangensis TaxID=2582783 RepID=A0AAD4CNR5_ASPNN|nr:hypothetical protein FE257_007008 [Aspergillus nanangensis]